MNQNGRANTDSVEDEQLLLLPNINYKYLKKFLELQKIIYIQKFIKCFFKAEES